MSIADFVQGIAIGFVLATLFWGFVDILYETWQGGYDMSKNKQCYFCGSTENLTKHHKIPGFVLKIFPELRGRGGTAILCKECHRKLHELLKPLECWFKILEAEKEGGDET